MPTTDELIARLKRVDLDASYTERFTSYDRDMGLVWDSVIETLVAEVTCTLDDEGTPLRAEDQHALYDLAKPIRDEWIRSRYPDAMRRHEGTDGFAPKILNLPLYDAETGELAPRADRRK